MAAALDDEARRPSIEKQPIAVMGDDAVAKPKPSAFERLPDEIIEQ